MNPENEVTFVDGMRWFKPREGAPDFVKGNISINPEKLIAFLKEKKEFMNNGYFSVDVKKAKTSGDIYLQLNTYKKKVESAANGEEDTPF